MNQRMNEGAKGGGTNYASSLAIHTLPSLHYPPSPIKLSINLWMTLTSGLLVHALLSGLTQGRASHLQIMERNEGQEATLPSLLRFFPPLKPWVTLGPQVGPIQDG